MSKKGWRFYKSPALLEIQIFFTLTERYSFYGKFFSGVADSLPELVETAVHVTETLTEEK